MATSVPLSERLKGMASKRFVEQAANEGWDYNTFVTQAATKGLIQDPNVLSYAKLLAEKKSLSRGGEVADVMQSATGANIPDQPPVMQPNQSRPVMPNMPAPAPGAEPRDPSGELQMQSAMPELQMQPTGIQTPGTYKEPETREQVHGFAQQMAQEAGYQPPTVAEEEQYGLGMYPTSFQQEQEARKLQTTERRSAKDELDKAKLDYKKKFDDQMMAWRWATENRKVRVGEQGYQIAMDKVQESYDDHILSLKGLADDAKLEIRKLSKGEVDKMTGKADPFNVDREQITELEKFIRSTEREMENLKMKQKQVGQLPGETRTWDRSGKTTTNRPDPTGGAARPATIPEPTMGTPAPQPTEPVVAPKFQPTMSDSGEISTIQPPAPVKPKATLPPKQTALAGKLPGSGKGPDEVPIFKNEIAARQSGHKRGDIIRIPGVGKVRLR